MTETNAWTMLWPGVVLSGLPLGLAWVLDRCLRSRAAVRSLRLRAALLASLAVAVLPIVPMRVPRPSWMPAPLASRVSEPREVRAAAPVLAEPSAPIVPHRAFDADSPREPGPLAAPSEVAAAPAPLERRAEPIEHGKYLPAPSASSWQRVALGAWLLGAAMLLGWSAWCHAHIARLRSRSPILASGEAFEEAAIIAAQWKMKPPRLLRTQGIASPFASGVWRPSICWPQAMESQSGGEPWRAILRHEMAHCRRGDCAWNALAQVARALLWPQPMLWWAAGALPKNSEDVCDEAALEGCAPTAYARGLLDLSQRLQGASTCSVASRTASAGALPSQPELSRRVARILKLRGSNAWRIGWRTRLATLAALGGVVGASVLATADEAPRAEEAEAGASGVARTAVRVDLSSPQAALDTFVAAVRAGDAQALSQCVVTVNSAEDLKEFAGGMGLWNGEVSVSPWRISPTRGEIEKARRRRESVLRTHFPTAPVARRAEKELRRMESQATARATVHVGARTWRGAMSGEETLRLMKTASGWKITTDKYWANRDDVLSSIVATVANPEVKRLRQWARTHGRASVEGQVLLADGSPAARAKVRLQISEPSRRHLFKVGALSSMAFPVSLSKMRSGEATTDERGRYRIQGLTRATYHISAFWPATPDAVDSQDADAQQIARLLQVRTREGQAAQAPTLKAQATARIDVLALDARDGKPLGNAGFSGYPMSSETTGARVSKQTGADGHAILNVPPGKVSLALSMNFSDKGGHSAALTSRGKYLVTSKAMAQVEGGTPFRYGGATIVNCVAGQTRRVTVRLMPYVPAAAPRSRAASTSRPTAPVQVDLSTPQAALDTFVAAVRAGDAKALSQSVQTVNSAEDLEQTAKHSLRDLPNVSGWRVVAQDGETTASAFMRDGRPGAEDGRRTIRLRLKKGTAGWQIQADPNRYAYSNSDPLTWAARIVSDPTIKRLNTWAREHGRAVAEGQVLLPDGSPAARATVRLNMDERVRQRLLDSPLGYVLYPPALSRMLSLSATTDARGSYRVEGLAGVAYSASAFWPAVAPSASPRGFSNGDADLRATHIAAPQKLSLREGEVARAPALRALRAARIEVLTVDARDNTPLQGATYSAAPASEPYFTVGEKPSGADGRLTLNVAQGVVRLGLSEESIGQHRSGRATVTRGRYTNGRGSTVQLDDKTPAPWNGYTNITTTSGQARRVTVRLMPYGAPVPRPLPAPRLRAPASGRGTGVLIGRVQYEDGRPAPNVWVLAALQQAAKWDIMRDQRVAMTSGGDDSSLARWDIVNRLSYARARTDASGVFRLSGLITAPYDLMTSQGRSSGSFSPGNVGDTISAAAIGVWGRDGQTIRRAAPIVLIGGAIVRGRITDKKTGAGVGGVTVACYGPHRPRSSESVAGVASQADGSFALRVAPGKNEFYFAGPSNTQAGQEFRFADDGTRTNGYVLTLPRNLFYSGYGDYQLDGVSTQSGKRGIPMIVVNPKPGETHTLNFQLRRLQPATLQDD